MADISSMEMKKGEIVLSFRVSKEEYEFLKQTTTDIMLVPVNSKFMAQALTTGKLGNSNRLMLPKKTLDRLEVKILRKKVPGKVFRLNGNVYLLVNLDGKMNHIPEFGGEENG